MNDIKEKLAKAIALREGLTTGDDPEATGKRVGKANVRVRAFAGLDVNRNKPGNDIHKRIADRIAKRHTNPAKGKEAAQKFHKGVAKGRILKHASRKVDTSNRVYSNADGKYRGNYAAPGATFKLSKKGLGEGKSTGVSPLESKVLEGSLGLRRLKRVPSNATGMSKARKNLLKTTDRIDRGVLHKGHGAEKAKQNALSKNIRYTSHTTNDFHGPRETKIKKHISTASRDEKIRNSKYLTKRAGEIKAIKRSRLRTPQPIPEGKSTGGTSTGYRVGSFLAKKGPEAYKYTDKVNSIRNRIKKRKPKDAEYFDMRKKVNFSRNLLKYHDASENIKEGKTTGSNPIATGNRVGKAVAKNIADKEYPRDFIKQRDRAARIQDRIKKRAGNIADKAGVNAGRKEHFSNKVGAAYQKSYNRAVRKELIDKYKKTKAVKEHFIDEGRTTGSNPYLTGKRVGAAKTPKRNIWNWSAKVNSIEKRIKKRHKNSEFGEADAEQFNNGVIKGVKSTSK